MNTRSTDFLCGAVQHSAAVIAARPAWSEQLQERLLPGANVVLLTSDEHQAIEARRAGFELRDTLLLLWPKMASFAFLLRRPLEGGALDGLIDSGAGALNIRGCRIGWKSEAERKAALPRSMPKASSSIGTFQTRDRSSEDPEDFQDKDGRWPTNIALIHGPTCRQVGEARIEGHKGYPNGPGGSSSQFSQKGTRTNREGSWAGHADADGKETVAVWDCQDSCPAKLLDVQTNDVPGPARFYPQFATPWELLDWLRTLIFIPGGILLEDVW